MDTLAFGYILPTTGRIPDLHRLETCAAGRTHIKKGYPSETDTLFFTLRARDGTRTRDPDLGKVVLHQLSHSRISESHFYNSYMYLQNCTLNHPFSVFFLNRLG